MDLEIGHLPSQRTYNWDLLESLGKCMQTFSKERTMGPCIGHCQHGTLRTRGTISRDEVFGRIFFKGLMVEYLDLRIS